MRPEALDLPFLRCASDLYIQWREDLLMHLGSDDFPTIMSIIGLAFTDLKFLPWQSLTRRLGRKMKPSPCEFECLSCQIYQLSGHGVFHPFPQRKVLIYLIICSNLRYPRAPFLYLSVDSHNIKRQN